MSPLDCKALGNISTPGVLAVGARAPERHDSKYAEDSEWGPETGRWAGIVSEFTNSVPSQGAHHVCAGSGGGGYLEAILVKSS